MELKGKVALVTGAAKRVGRVIALTLAEQGANVAITYLHDQEPWQETAAEIEANGVRSMALQLDVQQIEKPKEIAAKVVDQLGRIDILVNNASVWLSSPFLDISLADWQNVLDINLTGPFLCAQAVAPYMLNQKAGLIINITDLSAFQTWQNYAHHAASKAGLVALTRVMAVELAPDIRVNGIAPGTVLLPENAGKEKVRWATENSLLKRIGSPHDVAHTVLFLAKMDFVTGSVYFIDGGRALV